MIDEPSNLGWIICFIVSMLIISIYLIIKNTKKTPPLQGNKENKKVGCEHDFNNGKNLYCLKCGKHWSKQDEKRT